ncbi:aldo/keto reductase [Sphingobium phenoxybenzoativorans]|uniref:Aldo/keto reductase n=1 Tax=Sphingobium phenoxybenzoativorans TaxID=1592790 RepID=A0A975K971_9SPHN|nr:aldo/keto reductase [Sphingobium phenoxybenzoativorans]QUT05767.1 aldo/keto reductase [Sphingobium phenoxybenzoativorans]
MKYNRLGQSGLFVSEYCLGTPGFVSGGPDGVSLETVGSEERSRAILDAALDRGVNFIDTADYYGMGQSEDMIGRILGARRRDVVIATKAGLRVGRGLNDAGLSRRHLIASVEGSLKRLGTDWIDLFIVHRVDPYTPLEETLQALDDVVRQGKVRYIGYSNWPAWLASKAIMLQRHHGWARFIAAQMYYSLLGREIEHDSIALAEDAGIGIMAWSPLANGFLTGKYTGGDPTGGNGRLAHFTLGPLDRVKGDRVVGVLREIAKRRGATPAQIALAWVARQRAVASVLIGVSDLAQLQSNLPEPAPVLDDRDMGALEQASAIPAAYPGWYNAMMADDAAAHALEGRYDPATTPVGMDAYPRFYLGREPAR